MERGKKKIQRDGCYAVTGCKNFTVGEDEKCLGDIALMFVVSRSNGYDIRVVFVFLMCHHAQVVHFHRNPGADLEICRVTICVGYTWTWSFRELAG